MAENSYGVMASDINADYTGQGATGADVGYIPGYSPVVPDASFIDLPGQFASIPGGSVTNGGYGASDSAGVNSLYLDPAANPSPTGGYMTALAQIAAAASQAFTTYVKGSPSVAIPGAKQPTGRTTGGGLSLTTTNGGTNWVVVGGVVLLGVGALFLLAKYA
jgi:hypothetical protein